MNRELITDRILPVNCGERWRELARKQGKESPSYWMRILKLNDKSQIYHRWKRESIDAKELLLICVDLGITEEEFWMLESPEIKEPSPTYSSKGIYIEDRVAALERKMMSMEKLLAKAV